MPEMLELFQLENKLHVPKGLDEGDDADVVLGCHFEKGFDLLKSRLNNKQVRCSRLRVTSDHHNAVLKSFKCF